MNRFPLISTNCWTGRYGIDGIKNKVVNYFGFVFGTPDAFVTAPPDPIQVNYTFEKFGFSHFNAKTNKTPDEVIAFAQAPLGDLKTCLVGESWQWGSDYGPGWQESAIAGVHNCFRTGGALSDLISSVVRHNISKYWSTCQNTDGDTLSPFEGFDDRCLQLDNEIALADLADYSYCVDEILSLSVSPSDSSSPEPVPSTVGPAPPLSPAERANRRHAGDGGRRV